VELFGNGLGGPCVSWKRKSGQCHRSGTDLPDVYLVFYETHSPHRPKFFKTMDNIISCLRQFFEFSRPAVVLKIASPLRRLWFLLPSDMLYPSFEHLRMELVNERLRGLAVFLLGEPCLCRIPGYVNTILRSGVSVLVVINLIFLQ